MAELQGQGAVSGAKGAVTYAGQPANTTFILTGYEFGGDADLKQVIRDSATGEVIGRYLAGEMKTLTVTALLSGGTGVNNTLANAKLLLASIPMPVLFTVATSDNTSIDGTYEYFGGASVTASNDNYATVRIPLTAYTASSSTPTILTTAVA
jgi:hypothetical protein